MLKIEDFEQDEILLIKELCGEQFRSIKRLYEDHEEKELLSLIKEFTEEESHLYKKSLIRRARKYQSIKKNPQKIFTTGADEMSQFRHCLNVLDKRYQPLYPNAIGKLWERFFFFEKLSKFSSFN